MLIPGAVSLRGKWGEGAILRGDGGRLQKVKFKYCGENIEAMLDRVVFFA